MQNALSSPIIQLPKRDRRNEIEEGYYYVCSSVGGSLVWSNLSKSWCIYLRSLGLKGKRQTVLVTGWGQQSAGASGAAVKIRSQLSPVSLGFHGCVEYVWDDAQREWLSACVSVISDNSASLQHSNTHQHSIFTPPPSLSLSLSLFLCMTGNVCVSHFKAGLSRELESMSDLK